MVEEDGLLPAVIDVGVAGEDVGSLGGKQCQSCPFYFGAYVYGISKQPKCCFNSNSPVILDGSSSPGSLGLATGGHTWYCRRLHAGGRWPWSVTATAGVAVGRWRQQRRPSRGGGVIGGSHLSSQSNGRTRRLEPISYSQAWGDIIPTPKPENTLRICLQNVGGLPHTSSQIKNSQVISFVNAAEVDILALTETNVCWRHLPIHDRLPERTRGWWESLHLSIAYYSGDSVRSALQPSCPIVRN
jgi:hypothetical protein